MTSIFNWASKPKPETDNAAATSNFDDDDPSSQSLYEEVDEMLDASSMIYAFAQLRHLAREGKLPSSLLDLPVAVNDAARVIGENVEAIKASLGDDDANMVVDVLRGVEEKSRVGYSLGGINFISTGLNVAMLEAFGDELSLEELVYAVTVNPKRKRITVAFRGSVTNKDWMTDAMITLKTIPNPAAKYKDQPKTISIHNGFHDYLLGTKPGDGGKEIGSKCDEIMTVVIKLLLKHPGFQLYITGHSLGGALSTLFSFYAAASDNPNIKKPVKCVSIASPKVGSMSFFKAFQALEREGKLRHLRVANNNDLVTHVPDRSTFSVAYVAAAQSSIFRHVGLNLSLQEDKELFQIIYPDLGAGYTTVLSKDMKNMMDKAKYLTIEAPKLLCCGKLDVVSYHGCFEYKRRLMQSKTRLRQLTIKELYQRAEDKKNRDVVLANGL
mmetsp:Transcript_28395/g.44153  ORF Transcript_28395/g.44153 Transcript_28395/m.44153 type:complete len:440 (+) Transcript_28395:163-1482(+)|eukprot:CAMPEP_0196809826 /NCGR_PEP_ID=MMETSP1362-20130617/9701_1 /TAXON_ID=163516 /ORGANISM="Leptocylindrus danicus, Strain CCMP1856" /LENGTH=439 /DNA_ID=CAMNT_0042184623 /DNA_START=73 /DNA_END=1392 /DNA_ORIENTATION=-